MSTLITLIAAAGTFGTVLMFGTLGEILTEKSGSLNLGVEGIMYMGGAFGLVAAYHYETLVGVSNSNPLVAILVAILASFLSGAVASLLFGFLTITLRANQNVTGLALTILGTGVAKFVGEFTRHRISEAATAAAAAGKAASGDGVGFITLSLPLKNAFGYKIMPQFLKDIPVIGPILFDQTFFFYLAILLAVLMHLFFIKTKKGLYLRAVGESPVTADAAGINMTLYRYVATVIGGGISAVGGMVYVMTTGGCTWSEHSLAGVGWLAVALVIFCLWRPLNVIWGAVLFGALKIMYMRVIIKGFPTELYKILPYVVTVIVLVITSMRRSRDKQPPASLGTNYFREDR